MQQYAVIAYLDSKAAREQAKATATANHETLSKMIGRLLREEAARVARKAQREKDGAK